MRDFEEIENELSHYAGAFEGAFGDAYDNGDYLKLDEEIDTAVRLIKILSAELKQLIKLKNKEEL